MKLRSLFLALAVGFLGANSAQANSIIQTCLLKAPVIFGNSVVLRTERNATDSFLSSQLVEQVGYSSLSLGEFLWDPFDDHVGEAVTFLSLNSEGVHYRVEGTSTTRDLGTWASNALLPEPERSCDPSSDLSVMEFDVRITRTAADGSTISRNTSIVCTVEGGYHGYWGQPGCELEGETTKP